MNLPSNSPCPHTVTDNLYLNWMTACTMARLNANLTSDRRLQIPSSETPLKYTVTQDLSIPF